MKIGSIEKLNYPLKRKLQKMPRNLSDYWSGVSVFCPKLMLWILFSSVLIDWRGHVNLLWINCTCSKPGVDMRISNAVKWKRLQYRQYKGICNQFHKINYISYKSAFSSISCENPDLGVKSYSVDKPSEIHVYTTIQIIMLLFNHFQLAVALAYTCTIYI